MNGSAAGRKYDYLFHDPLGRDHDELASPAFKSKERAGAWSSIIDESVLNGTCENSTSLFEKATTGNSPPSSKGSARSRGQDAFHEFTPRRMDRALGLGLFDDQFHEVGVDPVDWRDIVNAGAGSRAGCGQRAGVRSPGRAGSRAGVRSPGRILSIGGISSTRGRGWILTGRLGQGGYF